MKNARTVAAAAVGGCGVTTRRLVQVKSNRYQRQPLQLYCGIVNSPRPPHGSRGLEPSQACLAREAGESGPLFVSSTLTRPSGERLSTPLDGSFEKQLELFFYSVQFRPDEQHDMYLIRGSVGA